jgi:hypothetical protein
VFGVPSVTLWSARELGLFAALNLRGKTVYVVTDSDWRGTAAVLGQGLICRDYLRTVWSYTDLGLEDWPPQDIDAHLVAPPRVPGDTKVGVDDWLGKYKGKLYDLERIERERPDLERWRRAAPWGRSKTERVESVLEFLSLHAVPRGGVVQIPASTIGRHVDIPTRTVQTYIVELLEVGAIHLTEGDEPRYWRNVATGEPEMVAPRKFVVDRKLRSPINVTPVGEAP